MSDGHLKNRIDQQVTFLTFSAAQNDLRIRLLKQSCRLRGVSLLVLHCLDTREKPRRLVEFLGKVAADSVVCCVDGFDVLCCNDPSKLLSNWQAIGKEIVFGAEKCCFHHLQKSRNYFEAQGDSGGFRFLNGGMFMGTAGSLLTMMRTILQWNLYHLEREFEKTVTPGNNFNDQTLFGLYAASNPHLVGLDRKGALFCNLWGDIGVAGKLLEVSPGGLKHRISGERPVFLHLSQIDKFYRLYVAIGYSLGIALTTQNINVRLFRELERVQDPVESDGLAEFSDGVDAVRRLFNYRALRHLEPFSQRCLGVVRRLKRFGRIAGRLWRVLTATVKRRSITLPSVAPSQIRPGVTFVAYDRPQLVGGTASWLQRLVPALAEKGIDVRCLLFRHFGETGTTEQALTKVGIDCSSVMIPETTEDRCEWLWRRFCARPHTVFVANEVLAAYYLTPLLHSVGARSVGVLHSDCDDCSAFQQLFVGGEQQYRLDAVVCVSQQLVRQVQELGSLQTLVDRIPCGVPVPQRVREKSAGRLSLVYAGRLADEQKRICDTVRALLRVCRSIPGVNAVIYGDGPDRDKVEKILAEDDANGSVRLGGVVKNSEIYEVLLMHDVLVLLSDYEGLPVVLLEAMAAGLVPVTMNIRSGVPEVIKNCVNGILVSNREDDFDAAVRLLANDAAFWQRLSGNARDTVVREFSSDLCHKKWESLLGRLLPQPALEVVRATRPRITLPPVHRLLASNDRRSPRTEGVARRIAGCVKAILRSGVQSGCRLCGFRR